MRQIVLDTETTGLEHAQGHRVIEIGALEIVDRRLTGRKFHCYLNPERDVDDGALEVHGLSNQFLADKPTFDKIVGEFIEFVRGAELVIHNAPFDIGFLDNELAILGEHHGRLIDHCRIVDTLALARAMHPGQKNSLDALCKRYGVDNSQRELHGALLDAEILADVYLLMTGGQTRLALDPRGERGADGNSVEATPRRLSRDRAPLCIVYAQGAELERHSARLTAIDKASGGKCLWSSSEQG
jgi:DNA polymerase III subunit epsilon